MTLRIMQPIKISLVKLGNLKFPISIPRIEAWRSRLFVVEHTAEIGALPNAAGADWTYTDEQLRTLIAKNSQSDFTVGLINAPIQHNFYLRRLENNVCILSLYETGEILHYSNIDIEQFIVRNLYELVALFLEHNQSIPESVYAMAHDETRSCLFDMCASKLDIVFSTSCPTLCEPCKARLLSAQLAKGFFTLLDSELRKIRKSLFFRIADFVKAHPVYAICITVLSGVAMNILANVIYDVWIKKLFGIGS